MAEGADRAAWDRTAVLWSLLANAWKGKHAPNYTPKMIHPYYPDMIPGSGHKSISLTTDNLDIWAQAVVSRHAKRK